MSVIKSGDISEAFRRNHRLQRFLLSGIIPTARELGRGSYGSVEEVLYQHQSFAGKKLHSSLIDLGNEGIDNIVQKFLQECRLLSLLRHPNITLFIGICFLPNESLPLLVMEKLEYNLDDQLENTASFPLVLKCSILRDVASGLLYLHKMEPPIVHRDLTARNVLLTASFVAKISDLGNSRIIGNGGQKLTVIPGTPAYMPPEAGGNYGPPLDIFSFGHLSLYTVTQVFPADLPAVTYADSNNTGTIRARTELERRKKYADLMESQIGHLYPKLVLCIKQCLHNVPDMRPSSENLLLKIQEVAAEAENKEEDISVKSGNIFERLMAATEELKEKDKELAVQQSLMEKKIDELKTTCKQFEDENIAKEQYIQILESKINIKDSIFHQLKKDIKAQASEYESHISSSATIFRQLEGYTRAGKKKRCKLQQNSKQMNRSNYQTVTPKAPIVPPKQTDMHNTQEVQQSKEVEKERRPPPRLSEENKLTATATKKPSDCISGIAAELKQRLQRRELSELTIKHGDNNMLMEKQKITYEENVGLPGEVATESVKVPHKHGELEKSLKQELKSPPSQEGGSMLAAATEQSGVHSRDFNKQPSKVQESFELSKHEENRPQPIKKRATINGNFSGNSQNLPIEEFNEVLGQASQHREQLMGRMGTISKFQGHAGEDSKRNTAGPPGVRVFDSKARPMQDVRSQDQNSRPQPKPRSQRLPVRQSSLRATRPTLGPLPLVQKRQSMVEIKLQPQPRPQAASKPTCPSPSGCPGDHTTSHAPVEIKPQPQPRPQAASKPICSSPSRCPEDHTSTHGKQQPSLFKLSSQQTPEYTVLSPASEVGKAMQSHSQLSPSESSSHVSTTPVPKVRKLPNVPATKETDTCNLAPWQRELMARKKLKEKK